MQVGGRTFPAVTSRAKKDGKREAADVALRVLVAEGAYQPTVSQAAALPVQLVRKGFEMGKKAVRD